MLRAGHLMRHRARAACAGICLAAAAIVTPPAHAAEKPLWEAGAGFAVINFPHYRGSDQRRTWVLPFPYFVYRGDILRADEDGVRGRLFESERVEAHVSVNASVPVDSDDNEARRGMPDLDPALEVGPSLNVALWRSRDARRRLELRLPVRAVLATDFSRMRHEGWVFQPNLNLDAADFMGQPGLNFGLLAGPIYSDRRYNEYFYEVAPAFATPERPAYAPGGGYAGAQLLASMSRRFGKVWVGGFARLDTLRGAKFEASPLVRDRAYFAAGFAIAWILGESKTMVPARAR